MFGLRGSVRNRKRHYGTLAFYSPSKKGAMSVSWGLYFVLMPSKGCSDISFASF